MTGPYATAADAYWQAGWRGVVPLPPRKKTYPPKGYTGEQGIDPAYADIHAWATGGEGGGNIALRLPRNIIGVDIDNYGDKNGAATVADATSRWGPLPPTWRTTSRDDGISGILLYRVPEGLAWPGELGASTEIIQYRHRYAVAWPSIHPEGRTYRWITPAGVVSTAVPDPDSLPELPETWVQGLTGGELASGTARNTYTPAQTAQWLVLRPGAGDDLCHRMRKAVSQVTDDIRTGSAHAAARNGALRAVRLADEGHAGLANALTQMKRVFFVEATSPARDRAGKRRRGEAEAEREWADLVSSAANLVTANPSGVLTCDCAGQLTGLITASHQPATDGATALAIQPQPADDPVVADIDEQTEQHTTWWPKDLTGVLTGHDDEPPPAVLTRADGMRLFYAGKVNGLLGESESGKTWIALLAVAQTITDGGHVVYLDFEDTARGIVGRLRALNLSDTDLARLHYIGPEETLHAAAGDDLRDTLEQTRPDLIVLDGFNAAMTLLGLDINDNGDATRFSQMLLRPLSTTGSCVVYVDHIPKNKDNRGKGGIGAQAKRAMTTGCAILVDVLEPFGRGMTGKLLLTVDKDRAGHVRAESADAKRAGTAVLTSDKTTGQVRVVIEPPNRASTAERDDGRVSMLMEAICERLAAHPDRASVRAIRAAVPARGSDIDEALERLITGGYLVRSGSQGGARPGFVHELKRVYTVADDLSTDRVSRVSDRVSDRVPDTVEGPAATVAQTIPPPKGGVGGTRSAASAPGHTQNDQDPGHGQQRVDTRTGEILDDPDDADGLRWDQR